MESAASRSARVKLQLRDKKGRWIEMGSHIKWLNTLGKYVSGKAVGANGPNVIAEVDSIASPGTKTKVEVNHKKVEVIPEKADLDAAAPAAPAAPKATAPAAKYKSTPTPTTHNVQTADGSHLTTPFSEINVGDKVYPIGTDEKPYATGAATKNVHVKKHTGAGLGTVTAIKEGKYATVEGADGKKYFPSLKHHGVVQTPEKDAYFKKAQDDEVSAMKSAGVQNPSTSKWISELPEHGGNEQKANLPAQKAPEPEAPAPVNSPQSAEPEQIAAKVEIKDDQYVYKSSKPIDISEWTKVPGTQMGSNSGGIYKDETGKEWYVKHPASNEHAMNEVLADDLYTAAGVKTSKLQLADLGNGKLGTASPMLDGVKKDLSSKFGDKAYMDKLQQGFAMDALLANWDVAGLEYDNVVTDANGDPVRVDPGGALFFRAQGAKKGADFGNTAGEWDTLRSTQNAQSKKVFGKMTDAQLADSAKAVEALTPEKIAEIVDASGFSDKEKTELKDKLTARRQDILDRAAKLAPAQEQQKQEEPAPAPEPQPETPQTPEPAPEPQAPETPAPVEQAPAPEAPAENTDPFAGVELKDKGKTIEDASGQIIKVGTMVTHSKGKHGKGLVTIVLPSTKSAKVLFENGKEQVVSGHLLDASAPETNAPTSGGPAKIGAGEVFFDTASGKTYIGSKDGTPLTVGDKISYTKKGETSEGTIKGIYKGQQTVNIDFADGTNSTKKASVLSKADETSNAPETHAPEAVPAETAPEEVPAPTPAVEPTTPETPTQAPAEPEAPAAPEVGPEPQEAPSEPDLAAFDGKTVGDILDEAGTGKLDKLPVGTTLSSPSGSGMTYEKAPTGTWVNSQGDNFPSNVFENDSMGHKYVVGLPKEQDEAAPAAEAQPATVDASVNGQLLDTITSEQANNLPVGTKLVSTQFGHYWQKQDGQEGWRAFKQSDDKPLDVWLSTDDLTSDPAKSSTHKLELPPEAPAVPETPVDVAQFDGEKLGKLLEQHPNGSVEQLPVGTKLHPSHGTSYWKKTGPDKWEAFQTSNDEDLDISHQSVKFETSPGPKKFEIELPKDATPEPQAEQIDEMVPAVDEGTDAKKLSVSQLENVPSGTKLVGNDDSFFIKKEDGSWDAGITSWGEELPFATHSPTFLKKVLGEYDAAYKVELPKPEAQPEALPAPKAEDAVQAPAPKDAKVLPVGTFVPARTGSTVGFTKTEDDTWEMSVQGKSTGTKLNDAAIQGVIDTTDPEIKLPEAEQAPDTSTDAGDTDSGGWQNGWWKDFEENAADFPVGTKMTSGQWYAEKTADNKWISKDNKPYTDAEMNEDKDLEDGYFLVFPDDAKSEPTVDATPAAPEAAPEPVAPEASTPAPSPWKDSNIDAADLPIGSSISKVKTNGATFTLTKEKDNYWVTDNGNDFDDEVVNDQKTNGSSYTLTTPTTPATPQSTPPSALAESTTPQMVPPLTWSVFGTNATQMPIGAVLSKKSAAQWKVTKTAEDHWVSGHGLEYNDSQIEGLKNHGDDYTMSVPMVLGGQEHGGDVHHQWSSYSGDAASLPLGSMFMKDNWTATKTAANKWDSNGGSTFTDKDFDYDKIKDAGNYDLIIGKDGAPEPSSASSMPEDGTSWGGSFDANDAPVGASISLGSTKYVKTPDGKWTGDGGNTGGFAIDSNLVNTVKDSGWMYNAPASSAAPSAAGKVATTVTVNTLDKLPEGTTIVEEGTGYTMTKKLQDGSMVWVTQENGQDTKFKDGHAFASATEVAGDYGGFFSPHTQWSVHAPGEAHSQAPAAEGALKKGMTYEDIVALPQSTIITDPESGYKLKKTVTGKWIPFDDSGNNIDFKDGTSYAAHAEVAKNSQHFPKGDWLVTKPGEQAPTNEASVTGADADYLLNLPVNTEIVDPVSGYKLKKNGSIWKAVDANGDNIDFKDGDSYAVTGQLIKGSSYFPKGDWTVIPPEEQATPSAPATPSTPTGVVGSSTNPAKQTGQKLTPDYLNALAVGSTIKKEVSSNYTSGYYWVKRPDGNWDMMNKSKLKSENITPESLAGGHFNMSSHTATVHQPKAYSKSAVISTGEIVYPGQTVKYKGETGYVASITNSGSISVQLPDGSKGYKAPSTLTGSPTYGLKGDTAAAHTATPVSHTPSAPSISNEPSITPNAQNFAGASADTYNAEGVSVAANLNTPKSGLTLASTGPVDTSNPLHGAPKPAKPKDLNLDKWDSAEWLKKVEDRYLANPNKAKSSVQQSNNWNTIQSVLEGHSGSLDKLLNNKYIDQDMFDEAKDAIAAHDAANKSVVDAHAAEVANWNASMEDWMAANPSATQFVDASMPNTSKEAFTGGEADWSKAAVGTYTADAAIAAIKENPETANHGVSVATDSDQIEDLNVKFNRIINLDGQESLEVKFKVTPFFAKDLSNTLQSKGATSGNQIYLPKFVKDTNTGLLKDTATSYGNSMIYTSGKRQTYTDPETGATVIFNRSSDADSNNMHTLNNSVRILMPKDSTSADYQKILENLGIKAKPATAGDIKVFAENKFITVFGGNHEFKKNFSGQSRSNQLQKIKDKYGVTPDDLSFGVDSNGDSKLFLSDEAVEKMQNYTKVSGFTHNLMGSGTASEQFFAMITGSNPGLMSTYQRWSHGIHASGMSSSSDMGHGSGDFMFTKVNHDTSGKSQGGNSVGINPKAALRRIDVYGNSTDSFGAKKLTSPSPYELMKNSPYEIMFKQTIPLSEWSHINISSGSERDKLIKRLKEHGITKINGIPLENFILTSGMDIPQIDPSVYNVVSG